MSVFGLDMGASGAVMCYVKAGSVDTILNEASKRKTPSLVSFYNEQR
jgi:molecular chaperone DnaK (HSP70)